MSTLRSRGPVVGLVSSAEQSWFRKNVVGAERAKIQTTYDSLACGVTDEKVSGDLKRAIIQGRTAKKMTQAQLAQVRSDKHNDRTSPFMRHPSIHNDVSDGCVGDGSQQINEKPQIVQEYEQGKAIPNNQVPAVHRVISPCRTMLGAPLQCAPSRCPPSTSAHVETRCAAKCHACRCSARWSEFWESNCAARNRKCGVQ